MLTSEFYIFQALLIQFHFYVYRWSVGISERHLWKSRQCSTKTFVVRFQSAQELSTFEISMRNSSAAVFDFLSPIAKLFKCTNHEKSLFSYKNSELEWKFKMNHCIPIPPTKYDRCTTTALKMELLLKRDYFFRFFWFLKAVKSRWSCIYT